MLPTALPPDFQFSQASLQDYADCHRRFYLRYLLELAWPAVEAEPADKYEAQLRQGEAFHRLVHQHQSGVPLELLTRQVEDPVSLGAGEPDGPEDDDLRVEDPVVFGDESAMPPAVLAGWWRNYLEHPPADLPPGRYSELTLSAPLRDYRSQRAWDLRLMAKYDLIAVEPGRRAVIVDWKTAEKRPSQAWLAARMQTRIYRYLLVRAGAHLNADKPVEPSQVEMIYWFANHPEEPERLPYDERMYRADEEFLVALIAEIEHTTLRTPLGKQGPLGGTAESGFFMTEDVSRCRFCTYRSLCDRGVEAGDLVRSEQVGADELGSDIEGAAEFDFEQIAEIAY